MAVSAVSGVPVWSLDDLSFAETLADAFRLVGAAQEVVLRIIGAADAAGVPARAGATSSQAWVRHRLDLTPQAAMKLTCTAQAVRTELTATGGALASGSIGFDQAAAISRAVTQLPADVDPDVRQRAEADLAGRASVFDAAQLARIGEHILTVIAPEVGVARDADALARQEERDRERRELSWTTDLHGTLFLRGRLDAEAAQIVQTALEPLTAPRPSNDGTKDSRAAATRCADALVELCRRGLAHGDVPSAGGEPTTVVVVHLPLSTLLDGLGDAAYSDGVRISPGLARQKACGANLIPTVLGGESAVLDLGRTQRLFTGPRRRAIVLRDKGCTFPGCDRPASWSIVHHLTPWWLGGPTDQNNGALLCDHHHRVIHQGDWTVHIAADGHPFIPPPWVDPDRRPQRNRRHESRATAKDR
ncbi:MAG: DUF222 domain-containing protein, partial [Geodermatophilaceae bacterium]|nr:DUF222 domain-containing protein [Geodermatophilaceae bacterium]